MQKMKAIVGGIALALVALVPLGAAHYDGDDDPVVNTPGGSTNRVSGIYRGSISAGVGVFGVDPAVDGFNGVAFGLCDLEILSDGSAHGATEDESSVEGHAAGGAAPQLWNDGGITAACHTPAGYYAHGDFNTGDKCADYQTDGIGPATAVDAASPHVWVSTVCSYGHSTGGVGLLGYAQGCITGAVLTVDPLGIVSCATQVVNCLTGSPLCPTLPGSTINCGPVNGESDVAVGGEANWDSADWPAQTTFTDGTATGTCADTGANGAVFVWNAVVVDSTTNLVSVPTVGSIA